MLKILKNLDFSTSTSRKRSILLASCIAMTMTMLLAFNTPAVSSSPTSILPVPERNTTASDDYVTNNSTIPSVTFSQTPNFKKAQQAFRVFLNQIAGINTDNYNTTKFQVTDTKVLGSSTMQTAISAIITNNQENLSIAMAIINDKVRFYDLQILNGTLGGASSSGDSLDAARNAISRYQTIFNATYCIGYDQLITEATKTGSMKIETGNTVLTVKNSKGLNDELKYELCWYNKIGSISTAKQSVQLTIAENGIATSFADNLGLYKVATTDVAVNEKSAISIATPVINAYASENDRTVKSMDAQLSYVSDLNGTRGDSFLLYPQWQIIAVFAEPSKDGSYGYEVSVWADSGEISHKGIRGDFQLETVGIFSSQNLLMLAVLSLTPFGLLIFVKRRTLTRRHSFLKAAGFIAMISLCSVAIAQPCFAYPSTAYGSTYDVPQAEQDLDSSMAGQISSWSSNVGYTAYNWYGSDTTPANLYVGAYDHGDSRSIVFHIGHGCHDSILCSWWGVPPIFTKDRLAILSNDGTHVQDVAIYDNSISQSSGHKKVIVLWSCQQGDTIGGYASYPDGSSEPHGMPFAWLHTNSLSSDGYNSPDYSGQAFIGWSGNAPFLGNSFGGYDDAGYWFLYTFYNDALTLGYNLNSALNYGAQGLWGVNFGDCVFHTGTGSGNMILYGQGTLYIGYQKYVTDINYWASGYSQASGVFNPYNLVGPQNDGQFAQLYAGNYGDYAWITGYMGGGATGEIHLSAHSGSGYYSHLVVYVSQDYYNWYETYDGYIDTSTTSDIYCGGSYGFQYIGICVYDDSGLSANMYIDAVHVHSIWA